MENENVPIKKPELLPEVKESKKEVIPSGVQAEMEKLIPYAGTIEITEEQREILFSPVKEEDIEIRSDGLVYLPWMEYVSRLRDAFGISWTIIPYGMAKPVGGFLYWPFYLMIQGKLAGFAIGEQEYPPPGNQRMTYGDATEACKSNALMRLCKGIGISLELWKPSFIRAWKEKNAEEYKDDKGKTKWRRKNGKQIESELKSEPEPELSPELESQEEVIQVFETIHKESEKRCSFWHDEIIKIDNVIHLKNFWAKHGTEIKKELLPEHWKIVEDLKNSLKEKLT